PEEPHNLGIELVDVPQVQRDQCADIAATVQWRDFHAPLPEDLGEPLRHGLHAEPKNALVHGSASLAVWESLGWLGPTGSSVRGSEVGSATSSASFWAASQ